MTRGDVNALRRRHARHRFASDNAAKGGQPLRGQRRWRLLGAGRGDRAMQQQQRNRQAAVLGRAVWNLEGLEGRRLLSGVSNAGAVSTAYDDYGTLHEAYYDTVEMDLKYV